jgi:hypothetical protein
MFNAGILFTSITLLAGCSSVMQKTAVVDHVSNDQAIVSFVRPSIFFGDGLDYDLWDGNKFIGVLGSGTIVQYKTTPGSHVFMSKGRYWAYVKADLAAGKQYFIKLSVLPFGGLVLSAIEAQRNPNVKDWYRYQAKELMEGKGESYSAGKKEDAERALKDFNDGRTNGYDLRPEFGI